jgi:hypothetical protein
MEIIRILEKASTVTCAEVAPEAIILKGDWTYHVYSIVSRFKAASRSDSLSRYIKLTQKGNNFDVYILKLKNNQGQSRDICIKNKATGQYFNLMCPYLEGKTFYKCFMNLRRHRKRELIDVLHYHRIYKNRDYVIDLPQFARYMRKLDLSEQTMTDKQFFVVFRHQDSDADENCCPVCLADSVDDDVLTCQIRKNVTRYDLVQPLYDTTFFGDKPMKVGLWMDQVTKITIWSKGHTDSHESENLLEDCETLVRESEYSDWIWYFHSANAYGHLHVNLNNPNVLIPLKMNDEVVLVNSFVHQNMHLLLVTLNEYISGTVKTKCIFDLPFPLDASLAVMEQAGEAFAYAFTIYCRMVGSGSVTKGLYSTNYVQWKEISKYLLDNVDWRKRYEGDLILLRKGYLPVSKAWYNKILTANLGSKRLTRLHYLNCVALY